MKEELKQKAAVKEESAAAATNAVTEIKEDDTRKGLRAPNCGISLDLDNYSCVQPLQKVTFNIPVSPGTKSRFITFEIEKNHMKVVLKNQPPIIDGEHYKPAKVDDSFWSVEDEKSVFVILTKHDQMEWWKRVYKGESEVDTQKLKPESSKLSDLNPETRSTVEDMMFD